MAIQQETKRNKRIQSLARGYYGDYLIDWLEEIRAEYSDVKNVKKLNMSLDTAVAVAGILEDELINPLKSWRQEPKTGTKDSGEEME